MAQKNGLLMKLSDSAEVGIKAICVGTDRLLTRESRITTKYNMTCVFLSQVSILKL